MKKLQWRQLGDSEWIDYEEDADNEYEDTFEVGEIYTYEYRMIMVAADAS